MKNPSPRHNRIARNALQRVKTAREDRARALVSQVLEKLSAPKRDDGPELPETPEPPSVDPVKPPTPPKAAKVPKPVKFNPQTQSGATKGTLNLP